MPVFKTCPRVTSGRDCCRDAVTAEAAALGIRKLLLVCGQTIMRLGIAQELAETLGGHGIETRIFDAVEPEPSVNTAQAAGRLAREAGVDGVLGIGGGSSLDIAKVCAVLATNAGSPRDFFGVEKIPLAGLPLILVPTSAGTGSEATDIAILSDEEAGLKIGIASRYLLPASVILDPALTLSMPPAITASSGMDALIHAMEALTSVRATPLTDIFAAEAIRLIASSLRKAWARGDCLEPREAMQTGSYYAGVAFCNAGVTAVHAFAYPIGAEFHIPHGIANSLMLLPVFRFNLVANPEGFARIAALLGEPVAGLGAREAAGRGLAALEALLDDLRITRGLAHYGVTAEAVPRLAAGALKAQRILANNPRGLSLEDAESIYTSAL